MSQKWNDTASVQSSVFGEFNNSSASSSQVRHPSSNNIAVHSSPASDRVHGADQVMMHTGHSSFINSSNNTKESCQRSTDCSFSSSNCELNMTNISTDEQTTDEHSSVCHQEDEKSQNIAMCFVCCTTLLDEKSFHSVKTSMDHSHAPLLVLLIDVLGYKLDDTKLHTEVVCKSCYHMLDIIDELQQTLTESKTDLRTKFLDTVHRLKLKYPRTDKMLKPRCLRCIQMAQSTSRKKAKGGGGGGAVRPGKSKGGDVAGKGRAGKGKAVQAPQGGEEEGPTMGHENGTEDEIDVDNTAVSEDKFCNLSDGCQVTSDGLNNVVFDTDPVFFSPDEKLKVGMKKEIEGNPVFLCMYCTTRYDCAISLKMHVRIYHMPVLIYDNGQGTAETRYRMGIKLQDCTPNEFSTTEKPFACLFCTSAYKLQSSLQFHFRENHSPHKPFQCLECKESFRRTIELSRHRLYRCPMRKTQNIQPKR